MPIPLSQPQFLAIANAAAALNPADRDPFIAGRLIGDGTIGRAIAAVQCRFSHPEPEREESRWGRAKPNFARTSKF